jgi:hypothetical protein
MLASYYKTAIRQLSGSRFHSLLNIIGLSVGIAFTLLVAVYARSEWDVTVWPFVLAIGTLALVVITMIAFQTLSTALANPTRHLRAD